MGQNKQISCLRPLAGNSGVKKKSCLYFCHFTLPDFPLTFVVIHIIAYDINQFHFMKIGIKIEDSPYQRRAKRFPGRLQ